VYLRDKSGSDDRGKRNDKGKNEILRFFATLRMTSVES